MATSGSSSRAVSGMRRPRRGPPTASKPILKVVKTEAAPAQPSEATSQRPHELSFDDIFTMHMLGDDEVDYQWSKLERDSESEESDVERKETDETEDADDIRTGLPSLDDSSEADASPAPLFSGPSSADPPIILQNTGDKFCYVCPECSLRFHHAVLLKWHRERQHPGLAPDPAEDDVVTETTPPPAPVPQFVPTDDPSIFASVDATASDDDALPTGISQDHVPHSLCFMFQCTECWLRFCTEELVTLHKRAHMEEEYTGPLGCPGCGWEAATAGELLEHVRQHGAKRRDRKLCRVCGVAVMHVQRHVVVMHPEEFRKFADEYYTLGCDQCGEKFMTKCALARHMLDRHSDTAIRCKFCPMEYPNSATLSKHVGVHKSSGGFQCPMCLKFFAAYGAFSEHYVKIHAPKTLTCPQCPMQFTSSMKLWQHKATHSAQYKFACEKCDKTFKRSQNLWQHRVTVHKEERKRVRPLRRPLAPPKVRGPDYVNPRKRIAYEDFPYKCEDCRLGWLKRGGYEQHRNRKHSGN
ncbi:zinc finger protein 628-like isoform X2 [Paramacrobiotus metropolitanus]|uniref:zinc finger protein 628-like isoform X2 n=1 Tax=Paramacrobiotus metropolitanus TaxID=2943436 RepID=UPI002445A37F|nr:zinc finger protein 628-like isoform X2 [Paramacrobiotus metropolitanus]